MLEDILSEVLESTIRPYESGEDVLEQLGKVVLVPLVGIQALVMGAVYTFLGAPFELMANSGCASDMLREGAELLLAGVCALLSPLVYVIGFVSRIGATIAAALVGGNSTSAESSHIPSAPSSEYMGGHLGSRKNAPGETYEVCEAEAVGPTMEDVYPEALSATALHVLGVFNLEEGQEDEPGLVAEAREVSQADLV